MLFKRQRYETKEATGVVLDFSSKFADDVIHAANRNLDLMKDAGVSGNEAISAILSTLGLALAVAAFKAGDPLYGREHLESAIKDLARSVKSK
jgi:hypothetical protein